MGLGGRTKLNFLLGGCLCSNVKKAAKNLIQDRDMYLFLGLGTKLSGVGIAMIFTCVLGLLCKDGLWMGKTEAGL